MTLGLKCARCGASSFNVHVTGRVNVVADSDLLTVVLLSIELFSTFHFLEIIC